MFSTKYTETISVITLANVPIYLFLHLISKRVFLSLLIALINPLNFPLSSNLPSYLMHDNHKERHHNQRTCAQDTFTECGVTYLTKQKLF